MQYIAAQFESYGLQPAGDNGTYFQRVPLLGVTMDPDKTSLSFAREGAPAIGPLKHLDQFVATDQSQSATSTPISFSSDTESLPLNIGGTITKVSTRTERL